MYRGTEEGKDGRTDREMSKIKNEMAFIGLYWLPVCGTKYK